MNHNLLNQNQTLFLNYLLNNYYKFVDKINKYLSTVVIKITIEMFHFYICLEC